MICSRCGLLDRCECSYSDVQPVTPKPPAAPQGSREAAIEAWRKDAELVTLTTALADRECGAKLSPTDEYFVLSDADIERALRLMRSPAPSGRAEAVREAVLRAFRRWDDSDNPSPEWLRTFTSCLDHELAALDAAQAQEGKRWQFEAADDAFGGAQAQEPGR